MPTITPRKIYQSLSKPIVIVVIVLVGVAGVMWKYTTSPSNQTKGSESRSKEGAPVPVTAVTVQQQSVPVWIDALGTVMPRNYVNVMPRVTGLLQSVNFREGQAVTVGQLLATIDSRPYRIQLEQSQAQMLRDQAQYNGAISDLARYETLLVQDSIALQQVEDQRAVVAQLKGTVAADKAALDNAQLQLDWTRITAPCSGIAGLRLVDAGNMVGISGAIGGGNSGLSGVVATSTPVVTIAQVQPITVLFPVTQSQLPALLEREHGAAGLSVQAWNQDRSKLLDTGKVIAADNQINVASGTVMLKAEFANTRNALFPNQFVNIRLLVNTLSDALVVPSTAIATGAPGSYVYVIDSNDKVAMRKVTVGVSNEGYTTITSGLKAGEKVVSDGLDRLRDGSKVQVVVPSSSASTGAAKAGHTREGKPDIAHNKEQGS
jgi:multidrug efflux system membrane fusion protein